MCAVQLAKTIADSVSEAGARLTTVEARIPRFVLAELNTHRLFSRNSASSRARPSANVIASEPYVPDEWPRNGPGMSPSGAFTGEEAKAARRVWLRGREEAARVVAGLKAIGVHKEIANRPLEPYLWHTVLITATCWDNFLAQRCADSTTRPLRLTAFAIRDALALSIPKAVGFDGWHLPLIQDDERDLPILDLVKISVARCARVSYLTHNGTRDIAKDLDLYERLLRDGHMSPFEHVAQPYAYASSRSGNFAGWKQHRKTIPREANFLAARGKTC